ncbi:hypothetical protein T484DRAFT_1774134 [Baffinella frigidus]|nr:hypothetical protein T484DRAFT_1774134 [Cryptophyta sp. CCMP2293]
MSEGQGARVALEVHSRYTFNEQGLIKAHEVVEVLLDGDTKPLPVFSRWLRKSLSGDVVGAAAAAIDLLRLPLR